MPISLWTGVPGAGKTLFMLHEASKEPHRMVFYFAIEDLKLNWTPLGYPTSMATRSEYLEHYGETFSAEGLTPVDDWWDLPDGSLIVIDEAYIVFPQRTKGPVPRHVELLANHRKKGFDIYLVCQKPLQLDVEVRRLVNFHHHLSDLWGHGKSRVITWKRCIDNPYDKDAAKFGDVVVHDHPKDVYDFYKSAEIHTIKKRVPKGLKKFIALAGLVAFCFLFLVFYFSYYFFSDDEQQVASVVESESPGELQSIGFSPIPSFQSSSSQQIPPAVQFEVDKSTFVYSNVSYLDGLPWTSRFYEDIYKAADFPRPHCILKGESGNGLRPACQCYTQQGSKLKLHYSQCVYYVTDGFFDPTLERKDTRISRRDNSKKGKNVSSKP